MNKNNEEQKNNQPDTNENEECYEIDIIDTAYIVSMALSRLGLFVAYVIIIIENTLVKTSTTHMIGLVAILVSVSFFFVAFIAEIIDFLFPYES